MPLEGDQLLDARHRLVEICVLELCRHFVDRLLGLNRVRIAVQVIVEAVRVPRNREVMEDAGILKRAREAVEFSRLPRKLVDGLGLVLNLV